MPPSFARREDTQGFALCVYTLSELRAKREASEECTREEMGGGAGGPYDPSPRHDWAGPKGPEAIIFLFEGVLRSKITENKENNGRK